jgi:hypothetical protein
MRIGVRLPTRSSPKQEAPGSIDDGFKSFQRGVCADELLLIAAGVQGSSNILTVERGRDLQRRAMRDLKQLKLQDPSFLLSCCIPLRYHRNQEKCGEKSIEPGLATTIDYDGAHGERSAR